MPDDANVILAISSILKEAVGAPNSDVFIRLSTNKGNRSRWYFYKVNASGKKWQALKMGIGVIESATMGAIGGTALSGAAGSLKKAENAAKGGFSSGNKSLAAGNKQYAKKVSGDMAALMIWAKQTNDIQCCGFFDLFGMGQMSFEMRIVAGDDESGWTHFLESMDTDPMGDIGTHLAGSIFFGAKQFTVRGKTVKFG
jgi:hypothetical protein